MKDKPITWWHTDADLDRRWADRYDEIETGTDDINLIRQMIGDAGPLRILEPMCGTGRILIPLAVDGHECVGMDISQAMLDKAQTKIGELSNGVEGRIRLVRADVTTGDWPTGFDVVILGGNWAFQLPSAEAEESCIASAAASLKPGGYLFHDSDRMEGDLAESWCVRGILEGKPWTSPDGVLFEPSSETIWFDAKARMHKSRRHMVITFPGGRKMETDSFIQKHPVSRDEIRKWLGRHGFVIKWDRETDGRITYWARKPKPDDCGCQG